MRALLDAGHRAIGLCNVAIGFQREIAAIYEVTPEQVMVEQVGLNHLTWIRRVTVGGDDVLAISSSITPSAWRARRDFPRA